jgi:hypothetical protein
MAFFIKDTNGCYIAVNHSLIERHGLRDKSQMLGRRPCDVCPGEFGRIPSEQDACVLRTGKPIIERLELQWHSPHKPVWCGTTRNTWHHRLGLIDVVLLWNRRITHVLSVPNPKLPRTAPRVTLAAADHPAACAHPAPAAFPQPARRATEGAKPHPLFARETGSGAARQ